MARSSTKVPSPAKCRATGATLEGRDWVRIGGSRWLREAAVKAGKFIPIEYREGYVAKNQAATATATPAPQAAAEENSANEEAQAE